MNLRSIFHPKVSKGAIAGFWSWFATNSVAIQKIKSGDEPILKALDAELKKIHPHLTYEVGPENDEMRELVISADGLKDAIPAVEETVKAAPTLPGWTVIAFRQPVEMLATTYYGNVILPPDDLWYKAEHKGAKLDLQLFASGYLPTKRDDYLAACFLLLDHLLGEYTVMTKVGGLEISILPPNPPEAGLKQFAELKDEFA